MSRRLPRSSTEIAKGILSVGAKEFVSAITSGQPDLKAIEDRIGRIPSYVALFKMAFADEVNHVTALSK
jgi:hypothetical protein